jgi:hypothetical protein
VRRLGARGPRINVLLVLLLVVGLGMLVRGLMTVSRSRAVWMARSVAATANVVACRPIERTAQTLFDSDVTKPRFDAFAIRVRYLDAQGQAHAVELPAAQAFQTGDPVDIRFDPKHPATVRLSEHFVGTDLSATLIVFGGALILISLFFFIG